MKTRLFSLFGEYVKLIYFFSINHPFLGSYNFPGLAWIGENWGENAAGIASILAFYKTIAVILTFMI